ncbi:NAD(P)-dependent alcohol dehydrogenase [Azospirillum griseum]|uniref:NAD(P)-dependent alcohol dehydrogenase n=1 Tax=Azospirillum griseum TaxID=2496639 RepID=A0A3S0R855_9PROT|nr:NAD(P)-dependent alcohol dehydrogenase [Azospirillum griseum]RTR18899.1 NAD(P)-dependent alcohol dehydrogenase [Azospirillum griseum]
MKALVLEKQGALSLQDIDPPGALGPDDVRIAVHTVGICGSDVHYVTHGRIGGYVVEEPMVLGHEASGRVVEVGRNVTTLAPGDRVCMEPGVPDLTSRETRLGLYNVDRKVTFWATPPVHGCLTPEVTHPAAFTHRLPDSVSFAEGALVEPFAIGLQAATKAGIRPGDVAVVCGAGTIGVMVALAALAGGCSRVLLADPRADKLAVVSGYDGIEPVHLGAQDLPEAVRRATGGWGANILFEASGSAAAYDGLFDLLCPGGAAVLVGCPTGPVGLDVIAAQAKEARIETVFRYANIFDRALALIGSGKVNLKPLISAVYPFDDAVAAVRRAADGRPGDIKLMIRVAEDAEPTR